MPAERRPRATRAAGRRADRPARLAGHGPSGRTGPVVAVTSASTPAGRAVVAALQRVTGPRPAPIRQVIAILDAIGPAATISATGADPGPDRPDHLDHADLPELPGVEWRQADLASPLVAQALAGAEIVVHVAAQDQISPIRDPMQRRAHAVRSAQAVTTAAAAVGARRLIAVTSAMVFGARPDNPVPLPDDCTARADTDDSVAGDLLEVERVLGRTPRVHPGLSLTLIRPAALAGPDVDTAVTRYFEAPRLLVLRGQQMSWQFCHLDDLASAVLFAVQHDLDGELTVGSDGVLDDAALERISDRRRLEVPTGLAFSTAERLHRVGVLAAPASELAYVVYPWAVGAQRLAAAGWMPSSANETCLRVLLDAIEARRRTGRRVDRRDAAMGAAGAAVALVGTAAILRQARSRRGRRNPPPGALG